MEATILCFLIGAAIGLVIDKVIEHLDKKE